MRPSTGAVRARRSHPGASPSHRFPAALPADPAEGAGGSWGAPFGLTVQVRYDAIPLISVAGELDVASAPLLSAVLEHVQRGASGPMEVDLREVSFADTHGLAPVLDAGMGIRAASAPVRRVLAALGPLAAPPRPQQGEAATGRNGRE